MRTFLQQVWQKVSHKMAGGLWEDADAANKASLQQIERTKGKTMAGTPYNPPVKRWSEMTDAEQKADIAARKAAKEASKSTQQTTKSTTVAQPTCYHDGEQAAFSLFDKRLIIAGASAHRISSPPPDTGLVIDLCGQVKFSMKPWVVAAPEALKHLKVPPPVPPDYLHLDWPDRGEPRCDVAWWQSFLQDLKHYLDKRVIICCVGSHGRTGTAMAALILAASPNLSVEETIKVVRKQHCYKAVESDDQVDYLRMFRPKENSKWLINAATDNRQTVPWKGTTEYWRG